MDRASMNRVALVLLAALATASAHAQPRYDNERTAEGWAWKQIRENEAADFNTRCGKQLDPKDESDQDWQKPCRTLSPKFVVDVLTHPALRDAVLQKGVRIIGARISGSVDLESARWARELRINESRIEGTLHLSNARSDNLVSFDGSLVLGKLDGDHFRVDGPLSMGDAIFADDVSLSGAKVTGLITMDESTFEGTVDGDSLQVGGSLFMRDATFKGDVVLSGAKVTGQVTMRGSTFEGTVDGDSFQVGASLFMRGGAMFKGDVSLRAAKVTGHVAMDGSTFEKEVDGDSLQVGGALLMHDATFKGDVVLRGAKVTSQVAMVGSTFEAEVYGNYLQVGGALLMQDSHVQKPPSFTSMNITESLDIRGATMPGMDLSGSHIRQEFMLGGAKWQVFDGAKWQAEVPDKSRLVLRNTAIGALQDDAAAWPAFLDLDGFTYARLGGFGDDGSSPAASREVSWWKTWLLKDSTFSPQPVGHLAATLAAHGNRDAATEIRFVGQELERGQAFTDGRWRKWFGLSLIAYTVGYGIGDYTFRAAYWVIFFAGLGAVVLWFSVPAARLRGAPWCVGASLSRLLPIVRLNKEFEDFFDDPRRERLRGWQLALFAGLGLVGWALGLFLVAAMTGLMQK